MKKIWFILAILLVSITCFALLNKSANDVIIELRANKTGIKIGDKLDIYYCIKNLSNKSYRFSLVNNSLASPFRVFDKNGKEFEWYATVWYGLSFISERDDLYVLKPNEERVFTFSMFLGKDFKLGDKDYKGYFLNYKNWKQYILLKNEKEFLIEGRYNVFDSDMKFIKKEYKFKDMFDRDIKSKRIKIEIK